MFPWEGSYPPAGTVRTFLWVLSSSALPQSHTYLRCGADSKVFLPDKHKGCILGLWEEVLVNI